MEFHEHHKRPPDLVEVYGAAILAALVLGLVALVVWLQFF